MSLSIRWQNFRSLEDTGLRELRPLTVVLGPNNSGKTSFIAPLLLLQQTLDAVDPSTALLTKGPTLDLGHYTDLVRNHDPAAQVRLMLEWHGHGNASEAERPLGVDPPGAVELTFQSRGDAATALAGIKVFDTYRRPMIERRLLASGNYSLRGLSALNGEVFGAPGDEPGNEAPRREIAKAIRASQPDRFFFDGSAIINRVAVRHAQHPEDAGPVALYIEPGHESRLYSAIVDTVRYGLMDELRNLTYIGPLRERARRLYALSGEMPRNVGTRGEFAPEILYRWRADKEHMAEVNHWLGRFGFRDRLELEPQGPGAFALAWKTKSPTVSGTAFVDMGFGLSQVLPIIVQGVLAESGSTMVAEQPEIHLNPRLQTVLGELFAFFIKRGVRVVIETHSEHLLLTIRRLVAQESLKAEQIALYFVEREDRDSHIREVPIEADGNIAAEAWPTGFFGDALRESLALSAAQFGDDG